MFFQDPARDGHDRSLQIKPPNVRGIQFLKITYCALAGVTPSRRTQANPKRRTATLTKQQSGLVIDPPAERYLLAFGVGSGVFPAA